MAVQKLDIENFLSFAKHHPVLDVRSPGEYKHAHIPGAYSFPLFTDEERKVVGTAYKQQSREMAIKIGLDFFGPKMRKMVEEAEELVGSLEFGVWRRTPNSNTGTLIDNALFKTTNSELLTSASRLILIHCWRGGMRSAAVAWLLDLYGFKVYSLAGGYKKYRQQVAETFSLPFQIKILGGYMGSGKTHVLTEMERRGATIVNLEKIASHKGSAFGNIGLPAQPSQEMFENLLAQQLRETARTSNADVPTPNSKLQTQDSYIWLEDESQRIGLINIPQPLWNTMRKSPIHFLDIPFEERLKHITDEYGNLDRSRMADAITRIQKRLGGLETKNALNFLQEGDIASCFRILLTYYDKWYLKGLNNREGLNTLLTKVPYADVDASVNANKICSTEITINE